MYKDTLRILFRKTTKLDADLSLKRLVITIIVMLILAGVSLNAIIGDNGIINNATYAKFCADMQEVQEAFDTWKISKSNNSNDYETTEIPVVRLVKQNELEEAERLIGEVGFYRRWSITKTKPVEDIKLDTTLFNSSFESEIVRFPAGVQDLYVLDNEKIGIKKDKKYYIDATTSVIYSSTGFNCNGIMGYSLEMVKSLLYGGENMPIFAEAETSGSGGQKLAGNVSTEYLMDSEGNYIDEEGNIVEEKDKVENPDYNPNGFRIISGPGTNNIYKLYNNGDLYAKGIKGCSINTPLEEQNMLDSSKFLEFTIPNYLSKYKKIISANDVIYIIDNDDELWAIGSNLSNRFGLTFEQQIEFTNRTFIKLNVDNKKVKNVVDAYNCLFVVTTDNKLYGCGYNEYGALGLGNKKSVNSFTEITFPSPEKINGVLMAANLQFCILSCSDNTFWVSGTNSRGLVGDGVANGNKDYLYFTKLWDGNIYENDENGIPVLSKTDANLDIDQDIDNVVTPTIDQVLILKKDGSLWNSGGRNYNYRKDGNSSRDIVSSYKLLQFSSFGNNVKSLHAYVWTTIIEFKNGDVYCANQYSAIAGLSGATSNFLKITLPNLLKQSGIKQIYHAKGAMYFLSNDNILFGSGKIQFLGNVENGNGVVKVNTNLKFKNIRSFNQCDNGGGSKMFFCEGEDGKLYLINSLSFIKKDEILQQSWRKVASNVKDIGLEQDGWSYSDRFLAVIDKNNDLYVCGKDARILGINCSLESKVPNLVKVNDEKINGKVKSVKFGSYEMYVLTTTGELYSTGLYSIDGSTGWPGGVDPGWAEYENHFDLQKIFEKVELFDCGTRNKILVADGNVYAWGNFAGCYGESYSRMPKKLGLSGITPTKITKVLTDKSGSIMIADGKLYVCGEENDFGVDFKSVYTWTDRTEELNGEVPIDVVEDQWRVVYVLTDKGNVYGLGRDDKLGLGLTSSTTNKTKFTKLPIENVSQITVGIGFGVFIKNDGTVWGTGNNENGVLGRWIGVDRSSPNSRYKTAFDWVECPELEI